MGQYATVTWDPLAPIDVNGTKFSVELSNKTFGGGLGGLSSKQAIVTATVKQIGSGYASVPDHGGTATLLGLAFLAITFLWRNLAGLTRTKSISRRSSRLFEPFIARPWGSIEAEWRP